MGNEPKLTNPAALGALLKGDVENALVAATPGGIEAQERAGQRDMVAQFATLPKELRGDGRRVAEALGFVFGEDVDELFIAVTAPPGWRLVPTEHAMHSDIVDDQGRVRGGVFYKAAFYDRRANGRFNTRFYVDENYPGAEDGDFDRFIVSVQDGIATPAAAVWAEEGRGRWQERGAAADRARAWLDKHYPEHADPLAYW